jgi:hypothetical protein
MSAVMPCSAQKASISAVPRRALLRESVQRAVAP